MGKNGQKEAFFCDFEEKIVWVKGFLDKIGGKMSFLWDFVAQKNVQTFCIWFTRFCYGCGQTDKFAPTIPISLETLQYQSLLSAENQSLSTH